MAKTFSLLSLRVRKLENLICNAERKPKVLAVHSRGLFFLTSSLRHPRIFVKEFFNGFVAFHDHCSGEKLSVEWQTDLYGRHCLSHSQHLVYA